MKKKIPAKKSGQKPAKSKRAAKPMAAKATAATATPKRKAKKTARAAAVPRNAPRKARATVIKKVIHGANSQALKILVEGVRRDTLYAQDSFHAALEHLKPEVRARAVALTAALGLNATAAGNLAIRVAELEYKRDKPGGKRGGGPWVAATDANGMTTQDGVVETATAEAIQDGAEQLASA